MTTFGIELEVGSGAGAVMDQLGLGGLHDYHCRCSRRCDPQRSEPDWTAQEDCTADGEFISRILEYGTDEAVQAIDTLAAALAEGRSTHSAGNGDYDDHVQGLHVHVGTDDMTGPVWARFWRLYFRYLDDLERLAQMSYDEVRSYNARTSSEFLPEDIWTRNPDTYTELAFPYGRGWLAAGLRRRTIEFRLWNATRLGWRIHLAAGVSVALVDAAKAGVTISHSDERTLFEVLSPYLNNESTVALLRAYLLEDN